MIDRGTATRESAVAQTTGYIVNLGVASVVIALLMMNAQGVVETLRGTSAQAELEVSGDRIAAMISDADRMRQASEAPDGEIPVEDFSLVSGQLRGYTVNVTNADSGDHVVPPEDGGEVRLRFGEAEVETVVVPFNVSSEVHGKEWSSAETTSITYNSSGVYLE